MFKFSTGAGAVAFTTETASPSPNLDVRLSIYDGTGNLIIEGDPAGLPGALNASLAAGTYYLAVDGAGTGSPLTAYNDYGSLGNYFLYGSVQSLSGNPPPVAVATASATSGTVPLTVAFSSAGSYDSNGSITGYNWDFGDGSAQSAEASPVHTYTTAGTFIASLVVFDDTGLSNTATVTIVSAVDRRVYVANIVMSLSTNNGGSLATTVVTIKNQDGTDAPGAQVTGSWSGLVTGAVSGTAGSTGQVTFTTKRVKKAGSFTLTVTGVSAPGATYDPGANVKTSATISAP